MPEPTRTLLNDLAIAGGCAVLAGALVACATAPFIKWVHDRTQDRPGGSRHADARSATPTRPSLPLAVAHEYDFTPAVERLIDG